MALDLSFETHGAMGELDNDVIITKEVIPQPPIVILSDSDDTDVEVTVISGRSDKTKSRSTRTNEFVVDSDSDSSDCVISDYILRSSGSQWNCSSSITGRTSNAVISAPSVTSSSPLLPDPFINFPLLPDLGGDAFQSACPDPDLTTLNAIDELAKIVKYNEQSSFESDSYANLVVQHRQGDHPQEAAGNKSDVKTVSGGGPGTDVSQLSSKCHKLLLKQSLKQKAAKLRTCSGSAEVSNNAVRDKDLDASCQSEPSRKSEFTISLGKQTNDASKKLVFSKRKRKSGHVVDTSSDSSGSSQAKKSAENKKTSNAVSPIRNDGMTSLPDLKTPSSHSTWGIQTTGECRLKLCKKLKSRWSMSDRSASSSSKGQSVEKQTTIGQTAPQKSSVAVGAMTCESVTATTVAVTEVQSMCYGCRFQTPVSQLSFCMTGHGCCGQCLQSQAKTLLASGRKGTLKCGYIACNSFYLVSQLRNSLPSMVVEILEEKLDREYFDNAATLMLQKLDTKPLSFDDALVMELELPSPKCDKETCSERKECEQNAEYPDNWEKMSPDEEYRLVDLPPVSSDYQYAASLFHLTMDRRRAQIVKVTRVQNPILWQFYHVKKRQMERDNNNAPVTVKHLFHGTYRSALPGICKNNFDWRLSGTHGTVYGQGSYFAKEACYSHNYTDKPPPHGSAASVSSGSQRQVINKYLSRVHSMQTSLQSCRFAPFFHPSQPAPAHSSSVAPQFFGIQAVPWIPPPAHSGAPADGSVLTQTEHTHVMFLARVLIGVSTAGSGSYRTPPPINPGEQYGKCYDSCVNDVHNPTIYVIFNSAQCYPEYIIEYTNKPNDTV